MKIKQTDISELKIIWSIKNRCVDHLLSQNIRTWDETYPSFSVFEVDQQLGNLFSIIDNNFLIGSVCINQEMTDEYFNINWSDESFIVIHRLMIDPKMQGKGFAKEAMLQLEKLIEDKGISSIRLAVYKKNKDAHILYEKLGFKLKGECTLSQGSSLMYEKTLK